MVNRDNSWSYGVVKPVGHCRSSMDCMRDNGSMMDCVRDHGGRVDGMGNNWSMDCMSDSRSMMDGMGDHRSVMDSVVRVRVTVKQM